MFDRLETGFENNLFINNKTYFKAGCGGGGRMGHPSWVKGGVWGGRLRLHLNSIEYQAAEPAHLPAYLPTYLPTYLLTLSMIYRSNVKRNGHLMLHIITQDSRSVWKQCKAMM